MKKPIGIFLFVLLSVITSNLLMANSSTKNNYGKEKDYEKLWKKVDSLSNKGLSKSALEVVTVIYGKAKSEKNTPQFIKAILHKMRFESAITEDFYPIAIQDVNKEISISSYPLRPILHSMVAEMYWRYYQSNRYLFSNRTETVNFKQEDLATWDLKKIVSEVILHYSLSLEKPDSTKNISLKLYDDILVIKDESKKYRPTLYDFLAHRAVDFFMNDEPDLIKPAYKFEITEAASYAPSADFIKIKYTTKDSFSLKFYALGVLQDLENFHIKDADPTALIDVVLKRLQYIKSKAVFEFKDSLFVGALEKLEKNFIANSSSTWISYEIANYYNVQAQSYKPQNSELYKWSAKKAYQVADEAIKRFPTSDGATNCKYVQSKVTAKNLTFTVESVNLPDKPFRALLNYKNVQEVYIRIVKTAPEDYRKRGSYVSTDDRLKKLLKETPVKQWLVSLPDDADFQAHSTEIKMSELPLGFYTILLANNKDFDFGDNAVSYANCWISKISYIKRRKENNTYDVFILDRETGTPLKNVSAQSYTEDYDYKDREYKQTKGIIYTTNEEGFFETRNEANEYTYFFLDMKLGNDRLYSDYDFYMYRYTKPDKNMYERTTFFTDRAIYRPGQTVYFKGIVLETDGDNYDIKPNTKSNIVFYDVNHQKISEQELTTNEYGTLSGTFTAPNNVMTGNMSIANYSGSIYFSVEEYKRPKFEVVVNPVKGVFKLNDSIPITGNAKAYAGNNIDGASVKYRVVRTATFPYWYYWWRGYNPSSPAMEILNGTTKTDENGAFKIMFNAIPDLSLSKKDEPTFTYVVYADVTDINGETHSSQKSVSIGFKALTLSIDIPDNTNKEEKQEYVINGRNLSGQYEHCNGKIEIHKLKSPDTFLIDRKWSKPDKFLMTQEEFEKSFPNQIYNDENNIYKWAKENKVLDVSFDTKKDSIFKINDIKTWKPGEYVLEATTTDKYGEKVNCFKYFTVFSPNDKEIPANETEWFENIKSDVEPGEKAQILLGTKDKNINVLYEIEHNLKIVSKEWIKLSNEMHLFEIPIKEEYRGNFCVHFTFVKNNRSYQRDVTVIVPYTNKNLGIEFETFRNKLTPGQKEEWKIKIKGKNGDKIAAEMLASMYDASLDAFKVNNWYLNIYNYYYSRLSWDIDNGFNTTNSNLYSKQWNPYLSLTYKYYDNLNWFGFNYYSRQYYSKGDMDYAVMKTESNGGVKNRNEPKKKMAAKPASVAAVEKSPGESGGELEDEKAEAKETANKADDVTLTKSGKDAQSKQDMSGVKARSNFNETAFFYPDLKTDENGTIIFSFTIPEALTKWKFMALAHTKDLKLGTLTKEVLTQKELMVTPNAPRFLREGDKITLSSKISNLSDAELTGNAQLMLFDASTMKPIDIELNNKKAQLSFTAKKGQSTSLSWDLEIPDGINAVQYKIVAKAGAFSDGEENALPVLSNRMLVTESMPLPIRGNQTKQFSFTKLIDSQKYTTLRNHKLTLEYSSNPAWYAVQALPYLMEYPYECAEQVFSRYYANSIASYIANSNPKIKAVFDSWKNFTPDALLSNLQKNQELKSLMLEETPWVMDAKNENESKQRIALLFDLNKMSYELATAFKKLEKMQASNGGWSWFTGMPDDRYITQHIVTGISRLDKLGVRKVSEDAKLWKMTQEALVYLDNRIREDYEWICKYYKKEEREKNHIGEIQIQYLYARAYFMDKLEVSSKNKEAFAYFKGQAKKYWLDNNRYMQGMTAIAMNRLNEKQTALDIIKSLKENAISNEEMGMYWKDINEGYYWYQAPIESQALLIEAFDEVANDKKSVEDMKVWLLKQKQTQNWKTTKATVDACYALLLKGTDMLASDKLVSVSLGEMLIDPHKLDDVKVEAGTGYFKTSWSGSDIKPEMGKIKVVKNDEGVAWGAVYWQYFEQLDKITPHETPLKLQKKLFVERNTETGPVIELVTDATKIKVGDKIKVRIELRVDRNMEYVHMKDMRASGFEPINVLSSYKYQGGLGYYESTRDAATNFFISNLPKGTYVFEYPLRVAQKGNFSNGITTIQCMYAPEFTSHSEGVRVKVGE